MPTGLSYSKISNFFWLFAASRISPSLEINSVYIKSAPPSLHTPQNTGSLPFYTHPAPPSLHPARNGGSLTSSIGASNNGNSPNSKAPILTILLFLLNNFYILRKSSLFVGCSQFFTTPPIRSSAPFSFLEFR